MMPEKQTTERAERYKERGKSPSTQAGEFVREEFHHVREGRIAPGWTESCANPATACAIVESVRAAHYFASW